MLKSDCIGGTLDLGGTIEALQKSGLADYDGVLFASCLEQLGALSCTAFNKKQLSPPQVDSCEHYTTGKAQNGETCAISAACVSNWCLDGKCAPAQ
jgi:hypothetical protein